MIIGLKNNKIEWSKSISIRDIRKSATLQKNIIRVGIWRLDL